MVGGSFATADDETDWVSEACAGATVVVCTPYPLVPCGGALGWCHVPNDPGVPVDLCVPIGSMDGTLATVDWFQGFCENPPPALRPPFTMDPEVSVDPPEPSTPDLCNDWDDDYYLYESGNPSQATLVVVTLGQPSATWSSTGPSINIVLLGTTHYHFELWRCIDRDGLNEYRWYVDKWGFVGTGSLPAWGYDDDWTNMVPTRKICYEGLEVDAGYVPCKHEALVPPCYQGAVATFDMPSLPSDGVGSWCGVPAVAPIVWKGHYAGFAHPPWGPDVPIEAFFLGYW